MDKEVDYIIVGQGLAGTLLSYFLHQKGYKVLVVDNTYKGCSSMVAAGIINPITGRKFLKSWMIDELLPFAIDTYAKLEMLLGQRLVYQRNIIKTLNNSTEENEWLSRSLEDAYGAYILKNADWSEFDAILQPQFSFGEIASSYQVNLPLLIKSYAVHLTDCGLKLDAKFDYNGVKIKLDGIYYDGIKAKGLIFCEGHMIGQNPWFKDIPMKPVKGEVLIVKMDHSFTKNLRGKIYLTPMGDNTYWVGSDYQFNPVDDKPSVSGREKMEVLLKELITSNFEVIDHKAGIRPASHDRRPILQRHAHFNNLYAFNGLGTKGSSIGPYFAHKMSAFIHDSADFNINT